MTAGARSGRRHPAARLTLARRTTTHPAPLRDASNRTWHRVRRALQMSADLGSPSEKPESSPRRAQSGEEGLVGSVIKKRRKKMRKHKKRKLLRRARHKRKR